MEKFLKLGKSKENNGNHDSAKAGTSKEASIKSVSDSQDFQNSQSDNIKAQTSTATGGMKRKRVKVSSVWKHFKRSSDNKLAKCNNCGLEYKTSGNTSNLADHLRTHHPFLQSSESKEEDTTASTSAGSFSSESASSSARSSTRSVSPFFRRASHYESDSQRKNQLDKRVLEMIALDFQPFTIVKDKGFKRLINLLDPRYVLPSPYTLSGKLLETTYQELHQKLKYDLAEIKYVAITCDSWTSTVSESYLTVTCHYISSAFELKSVVLSTKPLANGVNHTSENIAESLESTFREWSIEDKISCIVTDNASNMIKTCKLLKIRHLPFYAHTLNLVVQENFDHLKENIKKCKDIVTFIKSSNVAMEIFKKEQSICDDTTNKQYKLIQEVPTRWNSTFYMIERILKTNEAISRTLLKVRKAPKPLFVDELCWLNDAVKVLKCFEEATKKISGYIVGNAGLLVTLTQFAIAYAILIFTVSSVCAISTNGAVEGGGAYFMISRTLGPEFGGSIGTLFFFANVVSSALCISGCVEGLVENFGPSGYFIKNVVQDGRWWQFLYCTALNILNLIICLIGASLFAKTTVFVLAIVCVCLATTFFSFFYQGEIQVSIPDSNTLINATNLTYTGLNYTTLKSNLFEHYGRDYTAKGEMVTFATVFGVLFSGVTGIMAGANMSGELKNPSKSIPRGTLSAVGFTLIVYLAMSLLVAATTTAKLMQNNYLFLAGVSVFPASVAVGLFTATWSAALSNVIGGSRVLEALAKDRIFGSFLGFIPKGTWKGNPVAAVLVSALLVQLVLLIGSLNLIAQLNSVLFLLSYLATNLACLGLELAGAPNFRPSFAYFTWHTALIGLLGTLIMMFVINAIYAACSILMCVLLVIFLHLFSPSKEADWGSISQALIFHQVRKYLLLLDSRKDHVKFWRPQVLLLVNSPRSACPLIDFINNLKKGGLYVLGHVVKGESNEGSDPTLDMTLHWLNLVDHLKVKAFIELTVAKTVREGVQHLMRLSGMGAMKPNTIIFGFLDNEEPKDFFSSEESPYRNDNFNIDVFPFTDSGRLEPLEYIQMMRDVLRMKKNLCLCRNFAKLKKDAKTVKSKLYIDVWPVNFLNPGDLDAFDITSLFMMQLACIVNMVPLWSQLKLRIYICDETRTSYFQLNSSVQNHTDKLKNMLKELRIDAEIFPVTDWANVIECHGSNMATYVKSVNNLILDHTAETAVTFVYLPSPPLEDHNAVAYYNNLEVISRNLPPTIFVHGVSTVTSTTL